MFRYRPPRALVIVVSCASLTIGISLVRATHAEENVRVAAESDSKAAKPKSPVTLPRLPASEKGTAVSDADAKHALRLRAGEQVGDDAKGRALILGMALQEADNGRVKVVDVRAATPAFDAGVHKGDEFLSYQGFSADSYRKWIDGMRRLTTDAPAGSTIPMVVLRGGKKMALRIRLPETPIRPTDRALAAQRTNQQSGQIGLGPLPPAFPPEQSGSAGAPVSGGNDVLVDNTAPLGDFFGNAAAGANERAMARITRLNAPPTTTTTGAAPPAARQQPSIGAAQNSIVGAAGTPAGRGTRIGLAGFRDDPSGMVVMVDVGALPPGNYTVGITDPSILGARSGVGNATSPNPSIQAPTPNQNQTPTLPGGAVAPQPRKVPGTTTPAGIGVPQSNLPAASPQIPRSVLAQIAPDRQAGSTADSPSGARTTSTPPGSTIPPTGQTRPLTAPPTGKVNPSSTTPTGQSSVNNAQRNQAAQAGGNTALGAGASGLNAIGTLTVDQSGTGRMQQTVEGVQVRNVVGQAIVLYAKDVPPQTTLPSNLNGSAGQAARTGVAGANSARASQGVAGENQGGAASQTAVAAGQAATGGQLPVAGGLIRLISDRPRQIRA